MRTAGGAPPDHRGDLPAEHPDREDNPYGLLASINDPLLGAIASYSPRVALPYLPVLEDAAPGFRIGWARAARDSREVGSGARVEIPARRWWARMATADYPSKFADCMAGVKPFRSMYAERCRSMLTALDISAAVVLVGRYRMVASKHATRSRAWNAKAMLLQVRSAVARVVAGHGVLLRCSVPKLHALARPASHA